MSSSSDDPEVGKGFTHVDAQPDPVVLVAGMEATAQWPAVIELRAWERHELALSPGDSLLDVGCGIGDVARALAPSVQPGGRVLGIDASEAMLGVARERAAANGVDAEFRIGDALAIDEPDGSFDAVRSERMLQWLPDLRAGIGEQLRVLCPGGRLCAADSDWRTLAIDIGDAEAADAFVQALVSSRGEPAHAGGRLLNACRDAGLADVRHASAVHVWAEWDPDTAPAPSGVFPLESATRELADGGTLDGDLADRFIAAAYAAGRAGRFWMSLTMTAVAGRKP
jgi:SAM-dependent methyltransferase